MAKLVETGFHVEESVPAGVSRPTSVWPEYRNLGDKFY